MRFAPRRLRTIAVVTSSRADYSHLYWPLKRLSCHSAIALKLIVIGPHLSHEFGETVGEIERDGFEVAARVECLLSSDSDVGMAKTIGVAVLGLADALGAQRPDLVLLIADRYEMLAPASVALALRIPIAHIEGGEISEGAIDDAVRNALTKLSHVHFTAWPASLQENALVPPSLRLFRAAKNALDTLDAGITSARDASGAPAGFKMALERGLIKGPRTQISVSAFASAQCGHVDGASWIWPVSESIRRRCGTAEVMLPPAFRRSRRP